MRPSTHSVAALQFAVCWLLLVHITTSIGQSQTSVPSIKPFPSEPNREMERGDSLAALWTASSLSSAAKHYAHAAAICRNAQNHSCRASALFRLARTLEARGRTRTALASYRKGESLLDATSCDPSLTQARIHIATLLTPMSQYDEARREAEAGLGCSQSIGDGRSTAAAFNALAAIAYYQASLDEATALLDAAAAALPPEQITPEQANTHLFRSYILAVRSNLPEAAKEALQANEIAKQANDPQLQVAALQILGSDYLNQGELRRARSTYDQALDLAIRIGDIHQQGFVVSDLARYSRFLGESPVNLYEQAATLGSQSGDSLLQLEALSDLVSEYIPRGLLLPARNAARSEMRLSNIINNPVLTATALRDSGKVALATGNIDTAIADFNRALATNLVANSVSDQAEGQLQLGRALEFAHRTSEVRDHYVRAAALAASVNDAASQAEAYYYIALLDASQGSLSSALDNVDRCVGLAESLRDRAGSQDAKTNWFGTVHRYYSLQIDLLTRSSASDDQIRHAFEVSEASRGRALLELLKRAEVERRQGVDPALLRRETQLDETLADLNRQEIDLLKHASPNYANALSTQLAALASAQSLLSDELGRRYPHVESPIASTIDSHAAQQLLGPDELLLEYSLGTSRSYLWAVTSSQFFGFSLPSQRQIETSVRRLRDVLQQPCTSAVCEAERDQHLRRMAKRLSDTLIAPASTLMSRPHVIIVPDGALASLSFAILPMPGSKFAPHPLVQSHAISYLPSISTLQALRARQPARTPSTRLVAVFADPVFESDDPRLLAPSLPRVSPNSSVARSLREWVLGPNHRTAEIPRLPATRREATAIASAASPGSTLIHMGFDANLDTALSPDLANYRILHFATHSVFDPARPTASGILLSLYSRDGTRRDGYLNVGEIYSLNLSTELVVLSACNTALGREVQGEGVVGLARAFLYAGSSRVVATLWKVDDEATSEFMHLFYVAMLQHRQTPAEALRSAQHGLMEQQRWRSPIYWASFVLEGDPA
jgi:CHAT domain-containing protein